MIVIGLCSIVGCSMVTLCSVQCGRMWMVGGANDVTWAHGRADDVTWAYGSHMAGLMTLYGHMVAMGLMTSLGIT